MVFHTFTLSCVTDLIPNTGSFSLQETIKAIQGQANVCRATAVFFIPVMIILVFTVRECDMDEFYTLKVDQTITGRTCLSLNFEFTVLCFFSQFFKPGRRFLQRKTLKQLEASAAESIYESLPLPMWWTTSWEGCRFAQMSAGCVFLACAQQRVLASHL